MRFALLGCNVEQNWMVMPKSDLEAISDQCFGYVSALLQDGHVIDNAVTLQPTCTAKTVCWQNGSVVVIDGPFAETKEQLGGVFVLEARDMDHAVELTSKHPGLHHGAAIEIRPVNEESRFETATINARRPGAPAVNPQATRFATIGYLDESNRHAVSKDEFDALLAQCKEFDNARVQNGQWLSGVELQSAQSARTLRVRAGKVIVTDGPFAETKEHLAGVVVQAFKEWNDAVACLSSHPALPFGLAIEIRPIHVEATKRWETQLSPQVR